MEETSRHSDQEQDLIYALDIGTRSVIGLLARQEQDKMRVLEVERRPHERRTMLDGQIEDIRQVAKVVSEVTKSLEERSGRKLERACVAAAGRALRNGAGRVLSGALRSGDREGRADQPTGAGGGGSGGTHPSG